jgi:hypothetical protein
MPGRISWDRSALRIHIGKLKHTVDPTTGCLLRPGKPGIYASIRVDGVKTPLHRVVLWVEGRGPKPDGSKLHVGMHECDRRRCFNAAHLIYDTQRANVKDAISKGRRNRKGTTLACRRGHRFTKANTYWYRGYQKCRTCHAENERHRRLMRHARQKGML